MIDLHSHILPGIDDGAKTINDSLDIAVQSAEIGVSHMMCTPHIHQGIFDNTFDSITTAFEALCDALKESNCNIKLSVGCEVRITPDLLSWVANASIPFIGKWQNKSALLLELPHSHIPPGTENLLRWLLSNNIQPIIPHPERNRDIMADYNKLLFLKRHGCIFQVTAGALVGRFSEKSEEVAKQMLADNLVAYIASDTHSLKRRPNDMLSAKQIIALVAGEDKAVELTYTTPKLITQQVPWV